MEIAIVFAIGGGLAVRLGHNRWWTWVLFFAGLAIATSWLAISQQYLWKNSFLISIVCVGVGAALPDIGVGIRNFLRRPRTISFILALIVVGGGIWILNTRSLPPDLAKELGQSFGAIIALVIAAYGLYLIVSGPFRKKGRR